MYTFVYVSVCVYVCVCAHVHALTKTKEIKDLRGSQEDIEVVETGIEIR